ncbi:MAG: FtsX-like permease family protein, partial [Acidobacteriota bacterium]
FVALSPSNIPRLTEVGVDANVLAFAVLVSVLTSLLFGWIPALRSSRPDLSRGLKEGARGTGGSARQERLRNVLVIAETAVAFVLVVGAGLLIHSFMRLQQVDKGFDPEQVQVLSVTSPPAESSAELPGFYGTVTDRIAALPGVTAVGITANLPLSGNYAMRGIEAVDDRPDYRHENGVYYQHVTAGFFEAMGIPLRRGRLFDPADRPGSQPVAIVNTTMARDLFGADNPLGRRFKAFDGYEATWFEVIGVVGDVRTLDLARAGMPEMYLAFDQDPHGRPMDIVARTAGDERSTLPAMRALWHSLHPDVPVRRSVHMEELVASSIAAPRFNTLVLGAFAGVALILALVGIYGALAYSVAQRAHELGVRMALGATGGSVLGMILRRGMTLVLIGVALGLGGALLATRVLESLIFGISPTDGVTLALGVATVVVAALVASSIPAWRATRLDPLTILRSE